MESNLIVGLIVVGLAIVVAGVLLLVSRASLRRDQRRSPLDPDSVDEIRGGQKAAQSFVNEKERYREGTERLPGEH